MALGADVGMGIRLLQFAAVAARGSHGGALGPELKSRSCLAAKGTGALVSLATGSPLRLGTSSACFKSVSLPSMPLTAMEYGPARRVGGRSEGPKVLQPPLPAFSELLVVLELLCVVLQHPELSGGLLFDIFGRALLREACGCRPAWPAWRPPHGRSTCGFGQRRLQRLELPALVFALVSTCSTKQLP